MSLVNTGSAGFFAADRAIDEYARNIWQMRPIHMPHEDVEEEAAVIVKAPEKKPTAAKKATAKSTAAKKTAAKKSTAKKTDRK